jgi:hypothetical protein
MKNNMELSGNSNVKEIEPKQKTTKESKMKSNILNGAPNSCELDYHISNDFNFWSKASDTEMVEEVKYIISTYYESGHNNYEGLYPDTDGVPLKYRNEAKKIQTERRKELKELKAVLRYVENKQTERKS